MRHDRHPERPSLMNLQSRFEHLAAKMYGVNKSDTVHFYSLLQVDGPLVVSLGVPHPEHGYYDCWAIECVVDDEDGIFRLRLQNSPKRYFPCPQEPEDVLKEMEKYRQNFLHKGYRNMINNMNEKILDVLD